MFTNSKLNKKNKINLIILISLVLGIPFLLPLINAVTGNYSTTSPFNCGSNCSGGYELSGYNATYCNANPVDCFNTIDSCKDGNDPALEYVEDINITNLNGTNFTAGDIIEIIAYIDCDSDGDEIAFVYNNGSGFRNVNDTTCSVNGKAYRYYNLTLDDVGGNHTVRVVLAYDGIAGMTCGENATHPEWTDTDDVTFYVQSSTDSTNPVVSNPDPPAGASYEKQEDLEITICVDASDDYGVDTVFANITWSAGNNMLRLYPDVGNNYCDGFDNTSTAGTYNVTFVVNDTSGNINNTVTTNFTITEITNITVQSPTHNSVFVYGPIPLNFTVGSGYNIDAVFYSVDNGANTTVNGSKLNVSLTQSDGEGVKSENTTAYANLSMSFKPIENMTVNQVSVKLKRNGSGTPNATIQLRTDSSGKPSATILASGNITNSSVSATNYTWINIIMNTSINLTENTNYWLFLSPNSSAPDFYFWESSDDDSYTNGNYSNNASLDLLFIVYDQYKYRTAFGPISKNNHTIIVYANSTTLSTITSPQINFSVDYTEPVLNSISYTPSTAAGLDPNVLINFTLNVTDNVAVQQVIIQYKQQNDGAFQNTTTTNTSEIYNGNVTPDSENIWIMRIIALDTSNNTYTGSNISLNITYEYAWNRTPPSFNTTSALLNTNTSIGNITINNTGDFNYTFNISKTALTVPSVYFNSSADSILINVSPDSTTIVNVSVTGQSTESEQTVSILIDALNSSASPDSLYTNFTFISFTSGAYLDVAIITYDATVSQGQERVELSARITNAGNETANNISANWTLPSRWTAKTNSSAFYSSLGAGQQALFTRYFNIESDATTGNHNITIFVDCAEAKNDTDSRTVNVSSSGGDTGDPIITSGGGGGGILPEKISKLDINIVNIGKEIEIERGTNQTFNGILKNTGETDLENMSLSLEGFSTLHHSIKPDSLNLLEINSSTEFSLFLNIPEYFGSEKHESQLVVEAMADNNKKEFTKDITIIIITEDKTLANECFEKASQKIDELKTLGISITKVSLELEEVKRAYNNKDYLESNNLCQDVLKSIDLAINLKNRIASIENSFSEITGGVTGVGVDESPELKEMINLMKEAFERENYILAEQRAEQAELLLSLKEKEIQQTLAYRWGVIRKYLKEIIAVIIILGMISILAYSTTSLKLVSKRIKSIEERKETVQNKISQVQKKYFVEKRLPRRLYEKQIEHHRNILTDFEKKKNELKIKKLKIISSRGVKDLEKIRQEAEEHKKQLQRKYYVEKNLDKKTFKKFSQNIDNVIQDIDKRIALKKK